jgi:hypothetical protein
LGEIARHGKNDCRTPVDRHPLLAKTLNEPAADSYKINRKALLKPSVAKKFETGTAIPQP